MFKKSLNLASKAHLTDQNMFRWGVVELQDTNKKVVAFNQGMKPFGRDMWL